MTAYGVLDALGDPTRRSILESLLDGQRSVSDLAADLPVSRSAVSQHLKVLHAASLVTVTPHGTRRLYAVDPAGLHAVQEYFGRFWDVAMQSFAAAADPSKGSTS